MHTFSFEKLEAWKRSRALTRDVYQVTENFPLAERSGITSQLRRGIISVCPNLSEGSSRGTPRDQAHFYQISYSSVMEVLNQVIISNDLGYLDNSSLNQFRERISFIAFLISNLRNSVANSGRQIQ